MMWIYLAVGIMITFGGCYCCIQGCTHCSDATETETLQVDVDGIVGNLDSADCCSGLNRSYELTRTGTCSFSASYANGPCATLDCILCDTVNCSISCEDSNKICNPAAPNPFITCTTNGTVQPTTGACDNCSATETGHVSHTQGLQPNVCTVTSCDISGDVWDVDVMIADHPEATWAVPGDPVFYCNCTPDDCTAGVGSSSMNWNATIGVSGGDTKLSLSGNLISGTFTGSHTFTGAGDPVVCATEMDELDLSIGTLAGGDDLEFTLPTLRLCDAPTSVKVTYIP